MARQVNFLNGKITSQKREIKQIRLLCKTKTTENKVKLQKTLKTIEDLQTKVADNAVVIKKQRAIHNSCFNIVSDYSKMQTRCVNYSTKYIIVVYQTSRITAREQMYCDNSKEHGVGEES